LVSALLLTMIAFLSVMPSMIDDETRQYWYRTIFVLIMSLDLLTGFLYSFVAFK
jgi:hypothetical protein